MKQSERPNSYLEPDHKKNTNLSTVGQTTDISSQVPTIWHRPEDRPIGVQLIREAKLSTIIMLTIMHVDWLQSNWFLLSIKMNLILQ